MVWRVVHTGVKNGASKAPEIGLFFLLDRFRVGAYIPLSMTKQQVLTELRRRVGVLGSQAATARDMGCSLAYLNDVLAGRREPGPKILAALRVERAQTYRRQP
uniref:Putative DNA binding, helix-turn-helix domain containing protein n=1 Tax=viral metagenome TaxID=1070528 RepID=A0A6M3J748_9ZZZZ